MKEYTVYKRNGIKVIEVNTQKVNYQGIPWVECSEFQKRKLENYIFLTNNTREEIRFIYI